MEPPPPIRPVVNSRWRTGEPQAFLALAAFRDVRERASGRLSSADERTRAVRHGLEYMSHVRALLRLTLRVGEAAAEGSPSPSGSSRRLPSESSLASPMSRRSSSARAVLMGFLLFLLAAIAALRWRRRLLLLLAAFLIAYAGGLVVLYKASPTIWGDVQCTG